MLESFLHAVVPLVPLGILLFMLGYVIGILRERQRAINHRLMLVSKNITPPAIGSLWQHKNGTRYRVTNVTNELSTYRFEYPVTVSYENEKPLAEGGKRGQWSRELWRWHKPMTLIQARGPSND